MDAVFLDAHGDVRYRLVSHLAAAGFPFRGVPLESSVDDFDVAVVPAGPWSARLTPDQRRRVVLFLVDAMPSTCRLRQHFRHAIVHDAVQAAAWGADVATVVRPLCPPGPVSDASGGIIGIANCWRELSPAGFAFAAAMPGAVLYGHGCPAGVAHDHDVLATARFLVHSKRCGYLCNAVVKAVAAGVPVLIDPQTLPLGYAGLLTPGETCLVDTDPVRLAARAEGLSPAEYGRMRRACLALRPQLTVPDPATGAALAAVLTRVAEEGRRR